MKRNTALLFSVVASLMFSPLSLAQDKANTNVEKLDAIHDMLASNPSLIDPLYNNLLTYVNQHQHLSQMLEKYHDYIYNNPEQPYFGAKDPKLTIVALTDLSCPWCKKLDPVLHRIAKEHPNEIKVINIYVPLKEYSSRTNSATYALNIWKGAPEKYEEVSELMVSKPGVHNLRSIMKVAKATDSTQYVTTNEEALQITDKNYQMFQDLGVQGTPAILIDGQIIPGYVPYEKLSPMVEELLAEAK